MANEWHDCFDRPFAHIAVSEERALRIVMDQLGVEIGLQRLDAVVEVFAQLDPENSSSTVPLKRSTKPLVFGVLTLVRRCSKPLRSR